MNENEPDIQPKLTGPAHVLAAASYSLGGIRVLWREQALRHEILGAAIIFALHIILGVRVWWIVLQTVLVAMLFTAEAVNTAIEKVVDHLCKRGEGPRFGLRLLPAHRERRCRSHELVESIRADLRKALCKDDGRSGHPYSSGNLVAIAEA